MTVATPPPAGVARAFSQELGADGILVLTLDVPGEKVNTLGKGMMQELDSLLRELESRTDVRGLVLQSAKADNFIAGADIKDFIAIRSSLEGESLARQGQEVLGRLAALKVPVVAAIHGSCMGGGLETVLACRYRVASDHPKTSLGLPEVNLGIIPGLGGTQRLPRLVGLRTGLDLILTGRALKASRALRAGLVDEVVPAAILTDVARRAAARLADGSLSPPRKGISMGERLLRPVIFSKARKAVREKTRGHYPAPPAAIDVVEKGTATRLEEGLKLEAKTFGELSVSDVSRALVSVFFATQEIKKDAGYPEGTEAREVRKLAVVGAGLMGAGIAAAGAEAGVPVRMKDATDEALARGLRYVREVFVERLQRRRITRYDLSARLDRVSATLDYTGFRRASLVIEAVFEDLALKRRVLAEVEAATGDDCVFASNTSSLPIGDIARDSRRPSRVLGMHFFSPVQKMPLLEVIVTPQTDAWATATAVKFGRAMGKHVIVVRDGPGFYTSRALAPYMNEAARLVEEGASIEDVDRAMVEFGFPVGPITLLDEVGIDVGAKVAKVLHHAFGDRMTPPESMVRVVEEGRQGRKNGRGFYRYDAKGKRQGADTTVYALLPSGAERKHVEPREIQERLAFAFLSEAVLCLQEGILRSPRDGDVGAIFGLGFPPFLGGPFRYLDHLGPRFAVEVLERLRARHGERFAPARLLSDHAREGRTFY
ncbi:MAG TPA: fatty acid oxidation complex subunit alpha FadJ [Vicinamibacteria bacterium]|nr:fatty acid oxidation complex subunit alpha FadJ [Vicinamibacteria bacterium]